jgi:dihydrofolate synthase / folylpolyglutamate synthase
VDDLLTAYSDAIAALFARTTSGIKPGLDRTEALLAELGSPHRRLRTIHVAGTNGKGSVVATCEALLRATGRRVGRYTSPHLIDFRERITVDGRPIDEQEVLDFLQRWIPTAEKIGATFFEVTTALAFDWLARQNVDVAVIETGLGGRLDSTNVLEPLAAIVTSIGLDHTELLGRTVEAIALEKAGIFKRAVPAVIGEASTIIRDLLAEEAWRVGAEPIRALDTEYVLDDIRVAAGGTTFTLSNDVESDRITTPLVGRHQARNAAIAIAALRAIGDDYLPAGDGLTPALASVFLPGRFQRVGKVVFDVAHNPAGARAVAETLAAVDAPRPRTALVAVLADKDWRGIIRELAPAVDRFVFTQPPSAPNDRRWNPDEANVFAASLGVRADLEPDLDVAIVSAEKESGTLLVTGSFHTVGDVMSRLQVSPFAA